MLYRFVDFYMALHTFTYMKILFENYPKLVSYLHGYSSLKDNGISCIGKV